MEPAVSGRPAEPDLRTALEAAGFGDFIESGRVVVLPPGTRPYELVTVRREALSVVLNYAHHVGAASPDKQLREALAALDEEFF